MTYDDNLQSRPLYEAVQGQTSLSEDDAQLIGDILSGQYVKDRSGKGAHTYEFNGEKFNVNTYDGRFKAAKKLGLDLTDDSVLKGLNSYFKDSNYLSKNKSRRHDIKKSLVDLVKNSQSQSQNSSLSLGKTDSVEPYTNLATRVSEKDSYRIDDCSSDGVSELNYAGQTSSQGLGNQANKSKKPSFWGRAGRYAATIGLAAALPFMASCGNDTTTKGSSYRVHRKNIAKQVEKDPCGEAERFVYTTTKDGHFSLQPYNNNNKDNNNNPHDLTEDSFDSVAQTGWKMKRRLRGKEMVSERVPVYSTKSNMGKDVVNDDEERLVYTITKDGHFSFQPYSKKPLDTKPGKNVVEHVGIEDKEAYTQELINVAQGMIDFYKPLMTTEGRESKESGIIFKRTLYWNPSQFDFDTKKEVEKNGFKYTQNIKNLEKQILELKTGERNCLNIDEKDLERGAEVIYRQLIENQSTLSQFHSSTGHDGQFSGLVQLKNTDMRSAIALFNGQDVDNFVKSGTSGEVVVVRKDGYDIYKADDLKKVMAEFSIGISKHGHAVGEFLQNDRFKVAQEADVNVRDPVGLARGGLAYILDLCGHAVSAVGDIVDDDSTKSAYDVGVLVEDLELVRTVKGVDGLVPRFDGLKRQVVSTKAGAIFELGKHAGQTYLLVNGLSGSGSSGGSPSIQTGGSNGITGSNIIN